jgi:hypothetical protein
LFAALNVLEGTVIGRNMQRHRHQEFIRFLNRNANRVWESAIIINYIVSGAQLLGQMTNLAGRNCYTAIGRPRASRPRPTASALKA